MRTSSRSSLSSSKVLLLVAALMLVVGSVGSASAAGLTKAKVKKISAKVVATAAPGLSVNHATTADTATKATTADSATTAGTATIANGVANGSITGQSLAPGLQVFSSTWSSGTAVADIVYDGTTFKAKTIAAPEITASVIASDAVQIYYNWNGSYHHQLPYFSNIGGGPNVITFALTPGLITIMRTSDDDTPPSIGGSFRYVIIPNTAGAAPVAKPQAAASSSTE